MFIKPIKYIYNYKLIYTLSFSAPSSCVTFFFSLSMANSGGISPAPSSNIASISSRLLPFVSTNQKYTTTRATTFQAA